MNYPLVSVCIPAYNAEKYISEALDSVLDQSYPNIEIIVVNDGSRDNTGAILEKYRSETTKVIHQANRGQCAAANLAFQHSTGDYVKFFDADDVLSKDFITRQIEKLDGSKNAIASAAWGRFYSDDIGTFKLHPEIVWKDMHPLEWLVASLNSGHNMMQCGLWLIPRNVLSISGLWNEQLSLINDFDFFIRVILASKMVLFTEEAVLYYRSGIENSLSGQKSRAAMESAFLSTQSGVNTILSYENSARTRKVCADAFQLWKYQFYPNHMHLYGKTNEYIQELGGSDFKYPCGKKTEVLTQILGWKSTKRLKTFFKIKVD